MNSLATIKADELAAAEAAQEKSMKEEGVCEDDSSKGECEEDIEESDGDVVLGVGVGSDTSSTDDKRIRQLRRKKQRQNTNKRDKKNNIEWFGGDSTVVLSGAEDECS